MEETILLKTMLKQLFLTTVLCFIPSTAFAQWIPTARSNNGDLFLIQKESIVTQGNYRAFWLQTEHPKGQVAITRAYMGIDCGTGSYSLVYGIQADRNGRIVFNSKLNMPVEQVTPNSANSVIMESVCTGFNEDPQLAALTRARQINAEAINRAMETAANMFK